MSNQPHPLVPHVATCRSCGHHGQQQVSICASGPHYAAVRCSECNFHLGFLPKPDNDKSKYRRQSSHRELAAKFGKGYCEMCLRIEPDLPKGQSLDGHHVIEYQDGGTNERENVWVLCTACHKLVHWTRYWHGNPNQERTDEPGQDPQDAS